MINEKIIIQKMNDNLEAMERNFKAYANATNIDEEMNYWYAYTTDRSLYKARYETILLLGYDVVKQDNKIVGLKSINEE